ncbi:MAG: tyrosine-type recombinase/integrase [Bacteroidales bacterium]|nr:tyrosine-type recombinase/integrase [Candidatus Equimonas enterica]
MYRYNIQFTPSNKADNAKLYCRITWCGKRKVIVLTHRVDDSKWSHEVQRCKPRTVHGKLWIDASVINAEIQRVEDGLRAFFVDHQAEPPTEDEVKSAVYVAIGREQRVQPTDFFAVYNEFIITEGRKRAWGSTTAAKHKATLHHVQAAFPHISFSDISSDTMTALCDYFIAIGLKNTSTIKYIKFFKWFLRWCVSNGYLPKDSDFDVKKKMKTVRQHIVFLTMEELLRVYHHEFPAKDVRLERQRDCFCFQCFTGLRYSDISTLQKIDIYDDMLHIITEKTDDTITVELNDYSRAILKKYADSDSSLALPVISNQKYNKEIKEVGKACGIDAIVSQSHYVGGNMITERVPKYMLLSSHTGRRTFICNALMLGISPNVVMQWTGHNDYNAMKPYIDIADEAKKSAMSLFNVQLK